MPYSKRNNHRKKPSYTRRSRRRTAGRKGRGTTSSTTKKLTLGASTTVQKGYLPFGQMYLCKLPYVFNIIMQADFGIATVFSFRCNSLNDPQLSVGGHQPFQYDQLQTMYRTYFVHGFKYRVTFNNPDQDGMYVGIVIREDTNIANDATGHSFSYIQERRLSFLCPINNTGNQTKTFEGYIALHQIAGLSKVQYKTQIDKRGAAVTANPTDEIYLDLVVVEPAGGTPTLRVTGTLTYYAQLMEYAAPATS